uniref:Uncharacterized protein n=1 Tax=Triticum aestivum TaxID=4565 RepID=A0A077RQ01_WHEAT|nr:unnamed protein product [Triticum aestivum]
MAWAACRWTTAFRIRRCAVLGAARLTSPGCAVLDAPTAWPLATSTSWALVSTRRRTTTPPSPCNARPRGAVVVAAAVEVVVVDTTREHYVDDDCDGGSTPVVHVYGSVTAKARATSGERWVEEHSLFHRAKGQLARVPRDAPIPLQTTAVLVSAPLCSDSELQVSAELLDASASWQSPDHEIARGSVVFAPRLAGTDTAEIAGADGKESIRAWGISDEASMMMVRNPWHVGQHRCCHRAEWSTGHGALCEQGYEVILVTSGAVGVRRQRLMYRKLINNSFADLQNPQFDLDGKAYAAVVQSGLMAIYDTLLRQVGLLTVVLSFVVVVEIWCFLLISNQMLVSGKVLVCLFPFLFRLFVVCVVSQQVCVISQQG